MPTYSLFNWFKSNPNIKLFDFNISNLNSTDRSGYQMIFSNSSLIHQLQWPIQRWSTLGANNCLQYDFPVFFFFNSPCGFNYMVFVILLEVKHDFSIIFKF